MTSRRDANLTQNNNTTHVHTDFLKLNLEKTQKEVLQAIKDINISAEISGLTVESNDTITHEKLDTLNSNLVNKHLDSTTDSVTVNTIEGYATEETLGAIKVKTDDLTFSDNDGVIELRVFDSQNNTGLNTINNTITNKHLDSTTDSVTVNLISGFALETTQDAIKTKTDNLSFDLNGAITELITFDSRSYGKLGDVVTAINDKHLDSTTDSVTVNTITGFALESGGNLAAIKSNTDKLTSDPVLTDAIQVSIKNDILVVEPINNSINEAPYDLIINGPTLWADSLPLGNPFFADPNGREGWYYDNLSNIANKSNIYWYGNPTSGNFQENDMTFSQLSGMYSVITCDYVENGSLTIPTMGIFSQPTGTNDFLPGFAHSRWVYQLSALNRSKLRKGETLLLYTGSTRPNVHINLPSYQLSLVSVNGDALSSEIIAYMTVNTQATTSKIGYLLQYCGYLNSAIGFNREYSFTNSIERLGEQNLSSLTFEQGKLIIYSAPIVSAIANKHLEFGYDKVDASGSSVSISNFPATQPVSGTVAFSNTSIEVSGTVAFSNTSIQVSSMPNLNANTDSVTIVPNGDALPVSIASTVDVSGSVSVSNFPATQPISGSISNSFTLDTTTQSSNTKLDTIHADLDGLTFDGSSNLNVNIASGSLTVDAVKIKASNGDNLTATSLGGGKSGLDTASNMFGYAEGSTRTAITCDSAGKMNVNSNTKDYLGNGISSTTTSISGGATNSLDTASSLYVSNGSTRTALTASGTSLNTNITNTVPVSGTVAFSNTSIEISNLPTTQPVSGTVAISNTSINSRIYGSSNGTDWHHILTTPQGRILNNSSTQDGNGTNITSTLVGDKQGLDVYIANSSVPISGTINIRATNGDSISTSTGGDLKTQSRVFTDIGNATGTDITATRIALDTASSLYTADGTTRNNLTSTAISSIRALDVNVANTVAFSNTSIGISGTASVADSTGNGYLNTINQGVGYAYIEGAPVPNNTIAGNTIGTYGTWTRGQYRKTVFNYSDGNTANTDSISIYSKDILGGGIMIATFYPYVIGGTRQYSGVLELGAFNAIAVRNNSSSSISGVSLKIFSS